MTQGDRQNHEAERPIPRKTQRLRRLHHPALHRLDPGAQHLGVVRGRRQTQGDDPAENRIHVHADLRQPEVKEEQLHQKRRVAEHIDVYRGPQPQQPLRCDAAERQTDPQHKTGGQRGQTHPQRDRQTGQDEVYARENRLKIEIHRIL